MSVSENIEQVGLQQSGEPVAGVPIKKRPVLLSQPSSLSNEVPPLQQQDCNEQLKTHFCLKSQSLVSYGGLHSAVGSNVAGESLLNQAVKVDLNKGNSNASNLKDIELRNITPNAIATNILQDVNIADQSILRTDSENEQPLSLQKRPESCLGEVSGGGKFASSDNSAFRRVLPMTGSQQVLSKDGTNGATFVKLEKLDLCSSVLAVSGHSTFGSSDHKQVNSNDSRMKRCNWDLNIPMDSWDTTIDALPLDNVAKGKLHCGSMQENKVKICPQQAESTKHGEMPLKGLSKTVMPFDHNADEVGLDLQLKLPSRPEVCFKWGSIDPPDLSLSLTSEQTESSSTAGPSKKLDLGCQKSTPEPPPADLTLPFLQRIKREPGEERFCGEASTATSCQHQEPPAGRIVKPELLKEPLQEHLKLSLGKSPRSEGGFPNSPQVDGNLGKSPYLEADHSSMLAANQSEMRSAASVTEKIDSSFGLPLNNNKPCYKSDLSSDVVKTSMAREEQVGPTVSQPITPNCDESHESKDVITGKVPPGVSKRASSEEQLSRSTDQACEISSLPLVECDGKEPVAFDGMSEGSSEMHCSNDENSNIEQMANGNCQIGKEDHEITNSSAQIKEKQTNENQQKILRRRCGDGEYEDGEVKETVTQGLSQLTKEGEKKLSHKENPDCVCPVNAPTSSQVDASSKIRETSEQDETKSGHNAENCEGEGHNAENCEGDVSDSKKETRPDSTKIKLIKTSHKRTIDQAAKDNSPELSSKSRDRSEIDAKQVVGRIENDSNIQLDNASEPSLPMEQSVSSAKDLSVHGVGNKCADGTRLHIQTDKSNSNSKRLPVEKTNPSFPTNSFQGRRTRFADKFHRRGAHANRNERWDGRFLKTENRKNEYQPTGRHGSNVNPKRLENRLGFPYGGRNSDSRFSSDSRSQKGARFPRPNDGTGDVLLVNNNAVGHGGRRSAEDEPRNLSRFDPRRRSPLNPNNRFVARETSDALMLSHEENIRRALPQEMMEQDLPLSHTRLQYEQVEHVVIRRERSYSPGAPVHIPRSHSPHAFNGHPDMMRCRSPPLVTHQLRSPHQRLRLPPKDMMARRQRSPPYIQFHSRDPRDRLHLMNHSNDDVPRPSRGFQRNSRRFDMVGSQESADEDNFGPNEFGPSHSPELPEIAREDEYIDRRNIDRCRTFSYSRQHVVGQVGEEMIPPGEDGPARNVRFRPEDDVLRDGGVDLQDLNGRLRNRVGGCAFSRLREAGEQDGYNYQGPQRWRNGDFNGRRLKKRRY